MAENWNDWGDYKAEEAYKKRSALGKIFSWRTLGRILKGFVSVIIAMLILFILFRLFTNKPSKRMTSLMMTEATQSALSEYGELTVLTQETGESTIGADGRFTIYALRYIVETGELQFTVRYNNSTVKALKSSVSAEFDVDENAVRKEVNKRLGITESSSEEEKTKAENEIAELLSAKNAEAEKNRAEALEKISSSPFVFSLKDNHGNYYTDYSYAEYSKNFYQYVKVSFKLPELFRAVTEAPEHEYPSPDASNPSYIYKGANKGNDDGSFITSLMLDAYYENDADARLPFGSSLYAYSSSRETVRYDYGNELDKNSGEVIAEYKYFK